MADKIVSWGGFDSKGTDGMGVTGSFSVSGSITANSNLSLTNSTSSLKISLGTTSGSGVGAGVELGRIEFLNGTKGSVVKPYIAGYQTDTFQENTSIRLVARSWSDEVITADFNNSTISLNRPTTISGSLRLNDSSATVNLGAGGGNSGGFTFNSGAQGFKFVSYNMQLYSVSSPIITLYTAAGSNNVGINTTSDLSAKLAVKGSGTTSSTTSFLVQNANATASFQIKDNSEIVFATPDYTPNDGGNINYLSKTRTGIYVANTANNFGISYEGGRIYANIGYGTSNPTLTPSNNTWTSNIGLNALSLVGTNGLFTSGIGKFVAPTGGTDLTIVFAGSTNASGQGRIIAYGETHNPRRGKLELYSGTDPVYGVISFSPGNTEAARFTPDGNFNIGAITGSAKLLISGSSNSVLFEIDSPAVNNILYVSGSGRVGINTATPARTLEVDGTIGTSADGLGRGITMGTAVVGGSSYLNVGQGTGWLFHLTTNNATYTANSTRMSLTDNGVGFGNFVANGGTVSATAQVRGAGATSSTTSFLVQNANASGSLSVKDDGSVGIGTASPLSSGLTVANSAYSGYGRMYMNANNTLIISDNNTGGNITFGPSNRIFINTQQLAISNGYISIGNGIAITANSYPYGSTFTLNNYFANNVGASTGLTISSNYVRNGAGGPNTGTAVRITDTNINTSAGVTNTITMLTVDPSVNTTGGATTLRGIYYNPAMSSSVGLTQHTAIETTTGSVILNGGNVGIGTSTPNYTLDVSGSSEFVGNMLITGSLTISGSNAAVTMPSRPAFRVVGAGTTNNLTVTQNGDGTLNQNNWTVDYQQGSALTGSTGVFTAPLAGLYQISLVGRNSGYSSGVSQLAVVKYFGASNAVQAMVEWASSSTMNHAGGSSITYMNAGDLLRLKVLAGEINFDINDNWSVAYIG